MRHQIVPVLNRWHHGVRPKNYCVESLHFHLAGFWIAEFATRFPRASDQRTQVQREIKERDERAEAMQHSRGFWSADYGENKFCPVSVIKFQRHAGYDQQQETGHHEEMQKSLEGREAREPFVAVLRFEFRFAESF